MNWKVRLPSLRVIFKPINPNSEIHPHLSAKRWSERKKHCHWDRTKCALEPMAMFGTARLLCLQLSIIWMGKSSARQQLIIPTRNGWTS